MSPYGSQGHGADAPVGLARAIAAPMGHPAGGYIQKSASSASAPAYMVELIVFTLNVYAPPIDPYPIRHARR